MSALLVLLGATAGGALSITATPSSVLLDGKAALKLEVSGAAASDVRLTVSPGTVGEPQKLGGDKLTATWTPPKERFPQVALFLAETGAERAWLAVPLYALETLKLETKKHAKVEVMVGAQSFGPVTADARGMAAVEVRVPPGVQQAQVRTTDRAGNSTVKTFDLQPPPFARTRIVPVARAATASWADDAPLELEIFVVDATGAPSATAPLLTATQGAVTAPKSVGPGVFRATFTAPSKVGDGSATVRAAQGGELSIAVRPGPPVSLLVSLTPDSVTAGTDEAVKVRAAVGDAKGNELAVPPALKFTTELGAIEAGAGAEAVLRVPPAFGGRSETRVRASSGGLTGEAVLQLRSGAAAKGQIELSDVSPRAGERIEGEVTMSDAFGNPVSGATLEGTASKGRIEQLREVGAGRYGFEYAVEPDAPTGSATLELRAKGGPAAVAEVSVRESRRRWGISLGVLGVGHTNLARAAGGGGLLDVGLRLAATAIELVLQGSAVVFPGIDAPYPQANDGAQLRSSLQAFSVGLGPRVSLSLTERLSLHVMFVAGTQLVSGSVRIVGGSADGYSERVGGAGFVFRGAAGAGLRLGPGRVVVEVQGTVAPSRAPFMGTLGGLSAGLGYVLVLR